MTIILAPHQCDNDNVQAPVAETAVGAPAFFTKHDIQEFLDAMHKWQIPACTLIVDLGAKPAVPDVHKQDAQVLVWLLSVNEPCVQVYYGTHADALELAEGAPVADDADVHLDSYYTMASCSKPITAYALRLALQRAGFSWQTRVRDVLPAFRLQTHPDNPANVDPSEMCTFEDLMSHRSGLGGWHVIHGPHLPGREVAKVVANLPAAYPFRTTYNYASMPFHIAAHAVHVLDGMPLKPSVTPDPPLLCTTKGRRFTDFVQQEIFDPLGMTSGYRRSERARIMPGHVQFSGAQGTGPAEEVQNRLEGADCAGSGGVLMNARDLAKWLRAAPHLPGFAEMAAERIKDPSQGWLEWRDDGMRAGLGLRTFDHRGVTITNMAGTVPVSHTSPSHTIPLSGTKDFASMTTWFPGRSRDIAVGALTNAGTGGCYLRSLIRCRAAEYVGELPRKNWFDIIDKVRTQDLAPAPWMSPAPGLPVGSEHYRALLGKWTHPSFPDIVLTPSELVAQLPALEHIPYLPFLHGFTRFIFSPVRRENMRDTGTGSEVERVGEDEVLEFAGCFEVEVDGKAHCGLPFTAQLEEQHGRMTIRGWGDEGADGPVVIFTKQ